MADYSEMALVRGMSYLAEAQASIAHNLANVNSTGFKRQIAVARPVGSDGQSGFDAALRDALPTVAYTQRTDWSGGSLEATGGRLHLALEGEGMFMLDAGGQRLFTRNGSMLVDREGKLSNTQGHHYLDRTGQPISFGPGIETSSDDIHVSPDGSIRVGDQVVGRIGVFEPPDAGRLSAAGRGSFADPGAGRPDAARPRLAPKTRVRQGHLESSNVDSLRELVQMISIQRSFQASSRALGSLGRVKSAFINAVNR